MLMVLVLLRVVFEPDVEHHHVADGARRSWRGEPPLVIVSPLPHRCSHYIHMYMHLLSYHGSIILSTLLCAT